MGGIGTADVVLLGILGLVAYFIGNISPSTIMAKRQGIDIKKEGSGNAGTTNALRVMGKKAGAITCIVDILKGVVAVLIGMLIGGPAAAYLCALCVFLGHVWPIVYRFQGGKGVATAFGAVLAVNPLLALIALHEESLGLICFQHGRVFAQCVYESLEENLLVERPFFVVR